MASRDSNNMQIAVISLSLVLILLLVGLFLINNERSKQKARADSEAQQASQQRQAVNELQGEANRYKQMMGFKEDDTLATIEASFTEDMERHGSSFPEEVRFYSPLLENLQQENHKLEQSEATAKDTGQALKLQLEAMEAEKNKQIEQYAAEAKKAKEELAEQKRKFQEDRDKMVSEQKELASQLASQRQQISDLNSQMTSMESKQKDELTRLGHDIELLRDNQLDPDPFAQPADGMIRWVNQKDQKVWINLGDEDYLRPQVTFSVFSGDESDSLKAEKKGSIVVTKILSPHMAEARITSDTPTRPLQEGDKIYSQVWNQGRQVGFAIAGLIDLDGDGKDDTNELKTIIGINNGKIDAEPGEGGLVDGEMSVSTRFLVLGEYPENARDGGDSLRVWEAMTATADRLGIETITLDEFLQLMGWKSDRKTVSLGVTARPEDFPAGRVKEYTPRKSKAGTGDFIPRKPKPTY